MKNIRRPATGLLTLILGIGIAGGMAAPGSEARVPGARPPAPTTVQLQKFRERIERLKSVPTRPTSRPRALSVPPSAPLLPPRSIDSQTPGLLASAVGDVTADSRPDLVAFGLRVPAEPFEARVVVYPLGPGGIFGPPVLSNVSSRLGAAGLQGMLVTPVLGPRPDVVVWSSLGIEIYPVAADGTAAATPVSISPGIIPLQVVVADLDADGRRDLIVSGSDSTDLARPLVVRRFLQTPGGGFVAGVEDRMSGGYGVLADLDGDGIVDELEGINGSATFGFSYRLGRADGTFAAPVNVEESVAASTSVGRLSVVDVDGNGLADVVLTTGDGARVRFQTSPGSFSTTLFPNSGSSGNNAQISIGDLDGNGLRDLVLWTDGFNAMQVALQTSARVFTAAGLYDVPSGGYPSFTETNTAIADLNGDNKADILALVAGPVVWYNAGGSYPVLDASVTSTAQATDDGPTAQIEWRHRVSNTGPSALVDGFLLQDLPRQYEFAGASVACTFYVTLVVCPLGRLAAGESTTITLRATSAAARVNDGQVGSVVSVINGGPEIDTVASNDAATVTVPVRAHLEELRAVASDVFVYESAGEAIIPVIGAAAASPAMRCGGWYLDGPNPADGGIVGALNGSTCIAPAQKGPARGQIQLRDGSTANGPLRYRLAVSAVSFNASLPGTLTIVDDDGSDPRLQAVGAQRFEDWPALFSTSQTLYARQGTELPKAAAIGDLNQDGRADLAVSFGDSSGTWIYVWLQQPNGTLSATPLKWNGSRSIPTLAIGDVTGDGAAEIVVPQYTELDLVRLVNGQLQTVDSVALDCWHVAVADLDLDGFKDLVVADSRDQSPYGPNYWRANVSVFHGNAQRTLDPSPYRFAMPYNAVRSQLVIGKFDADARPDIAMTSSGAPEFPSASIAYQNSNGTFGAPVGVWIAGPGSLDGEAYGENATAGDFNGDGRTDLAISSYVGEYLPSVWIFEDLRHDDASRPTQRLDAGLARSLAALDVDLDGRDDLLVDYSIPPLGPRTPLQVYLQNASGKLVDAGKLPKFGSGLADPWIQKLATGDLDGDGRADAVIIDSMDGYVHLIHSAAANPALQISALEASSSVIAGASVRYRLRVTNGGGRASPEIPIAWSLPPSITSPQIVAAKGACYLEASSAQCLLPPLDPGGYVDVMLTGALPAAGSYSMAITAGPAGAYGNASVSTTVTAPSSGGGSSSGGASGGGSSGGGGSLEWLTLAALLACAAWRMHAIAGTTTARRRRGSTPGSPTAASRPSP